LCASAGSMAGPRIPTDVKPNKFVEANGYAREVVENTFRFSLKNLGKFAIFGIAVPVLIYKGCVQEFVSAPPPIPDIATRSADRRRRRALGTFGGDPRVVDARLLAFARRPVAVAGDGAPLSPRRGGNPSEHFPLSRLLSGPKPSTDRL